MIKNYAIDDSSVNFIFHNGKIKIAQYDYYDSCPIFMGVYILNFLRKRLPIKSN